MTHEPEVALSQSDIQSYERRGVALLEGVIGEPWLSSLAAAIERDIADPAPGYHGYENQAGRFHGNFDLWRTDDDFADYCLRSPLPALAAAFMNSGEVKLLYDQLFVKEPGTPVRTPWHNDQPYFPVSGWNVISFWLALDPVTVDSGAVEYVAGSHLWDRWFQPRTFAAGGFRYDENPEYEPVPDVEADRESYDIVAFEMQPGDVLAFHALSLHGAGGNLRRDVRRRGYTVRYTGDGVVYDPRVGTNPGLHRADHSVGAPLDPAIFPVVWPARPASN